MKYFLISLHDDHERIFGKIELTPINKDEAEIFFENNGFRLDKIEEEIIHFCVECKKDFRGKPDLNFETCRCEECDVNVLEGES